MLSVLDSLVVSLLFGDLSIDDLIDATTGQAVTSSEHRYGYLVLLFVQTEVVTIDPKITVTTASFLHCRHLPLLCSQ